MAKRLLPYTVKNNLAELIIQRQALKQMETGASYNIREVEEELASYCGISRSGIIQIKRQENIPSLPLAFKMAEYFKKDISKIFFLVEE